MIYVRSLKGLIYELILELLINKQMINFHKIYITWIQIN
jgi:hypothetical protein